LEIERTSNEKNLELRGDHTRWGPVVWSDKKKEGTWRWLKRDL